MLIREREPFDGLAKIFVQRDVVFQLHVASWWAVAGGGESVLGSVLEPVADGYAAQFVRLAEFDPSALEDGVVFGLCLLYTSPSPRD